MSLLEIWLLGPPRFSLAGVPMEFDRRKVTALLAYLAVKAAPASRDHLTNLLFPELDRDHAAGDFRQVLSVLKAAIGESHLLAGRDFVSLRGGFQTDVKRFRDAVARAREAPAEALLVEAVGLYGGDFLAGYFLKKNLEFENWQLLEQEALRQDFLWCLGALSQHHAETKQWEKAISWGQRWVHEDPVEEEAYRHLMRCYDKSGQPALAKVQFERCRALLEQEFACAPDAATLEVWDKIQKRQRTLPAVSSRLVGRADTVDALAQLLSLRKGAVTTLVGPPGIGKTRLAIALATRLQDRYADGTFFVDLGPVSRVEHLLPAVVTALGLRDPQGPDRDPLQHLIRALGRRQVLVLFDGFEGLLAAAPLLARLVLACPRLQVVVTSREALRVPGEVVYPVPPLDLPSSVQLFWERARFVRASGTESDEENALVRDLCLRLDGLPLAIELVAGRSSVLTLKELKERMHDRATLTNRLDQEIDRSFQTLGVGARTLLVGLELFSGSASLEAIEAVCADEVEALWNDLEVLQSKNLLRRYEASGHSRFALLDAMAAFARARTAEFIDRDEAEARHERYYRQWVQEMVPGLHGPDQQTVLARLEDDRPNLNRVLSRMLAGACPEAGLELAVSLVWFWYRAGHLDEGETWLRLARARVPHPAPDLDARARHGLGWLVFTKGNWSEALALYRQSLALFEATNDRRSQGRVLADLGVVLCWAGEVEEGGRCAGQALAIAREAADPHDVLTAQIWAFATTGGRFLHPRQREELEEALRTSKERGNLWVTAHALNGLADLCCEAGEPACVPFYQESLEQFRRLGDRWMMAWNLEGLGKFAWLQKEHTAAHDYWRRALDLFYVVGDRRHALTVLNSIAVAVPPDEEGDDLLRGACEALGASPTEAATRPCSPARARGRTLTYDQVVRWTLDRGTPA